MFYCGEFAVKEVFAESKGESSTKVQTSIGEIRNYPYTHQSATGRHSMRRLLQPCSILNIISKGRSGKKILDPHGQFLQKWNKIFVSLCVLAAYSDALFFYIPLVDEDKKCIDFDRKVEITAIVLRSLIDMLYIKHIIFQFQTGFYEYTSREYGKGVLVKDLKAIAKRYLFSYFVIDILSVLPLPQVVIVCVIPLMHGSKSIYRSNVIEYIVLSQYVPRVLRVIPLYMKVTKTSGILTERAWAGAALNFSLYTLASHVVGSLYYWFSIGREITCWREACGDRDRCVDFSVYCYNGAQNRSYIDDSCPIQTPNPAKFNFGIFLEALQSGILKSDSYPKKFVYCFWWGLQNLSSLGQNLETSTYIWEMWFAICIAISGLLIFSLFIANMQTYLQSNTIRLEEMRVKRRDSDEWMSRRLFPNHLRKQIRRYEEYKWQETKGVDEETLINDLPKHLQKKIKRHLCIDLLRRVPMFEVMDDYILGAMCHRLKLVLLTEDSCILEEGDQVDEMLFVMTGTLCIFTTNIERTLHLGPLGPGDFCGEELLYWALDPRSSCNLPLSTRSIRSTSDVEAFTLPADALKIIASQFRNIYGKRLRHMFRFYSLEWRKWAACTIQHAWRRYFRRKMGKFLMEKENRVQDVLGKKGESSRTLGDVTCISRFTAKRLRSLRKKRAKGTMTPERFLPPIVLQMPSEPDFIAEDD